MPIAKITGQGLVAIGISVGLLWGCLIAERVANAHALRDRELVMQQIQRLRKSQSEPVSYPVTEEGHGSHSVAS